MPPIIKSFTQEDVNQVNFIKIVSLKDSSIIPMAVLLQCLQVPTHLLPIIKVLLEC